MRLIWLASAMMMLAISGECAPACARHQRSVAEKPSAAPSGRAPAAMRDAGPHGIKMPENRPAEIARAARQCRASKCFAASVNQPIAAMAWVVSVRPRQRGCRRFSQSGRGGQEQRRRRRC